MVDQMILVQFQVHKSLLIRAIITIAFRPETDFQMQHVHFFYVIYLE